ncbi:hypothetical protein E4U15_004989 [Claviceps sp. LM218 group G6]|nr:hypothetical protein E4U15_004989 [Claviceps sp. LM218 group G6]
MLSVRGIRHVCARSTLRPAHSLRTCCARAHPAAFNHHLVLARGTGADCTLSRRKFSSSPLVRDTSSTDSQSLEEIEKVVRDAKQRFRDTLPRGYLNEQEHALYVRLYGPPLRETEPEDVGIPTHADMGEDGPWLAEEVTLSRELEDGEFEDVAYTIEEPSPESEVEPSETDPIEENGAEPMEKAPGYVDVVARNQREFDALQRLAQDFEAAQTRAMEDAVAAADGEETDAQEQTYWSPETEEHEWPDLEEGEPGDDQRYHRYTLEGRFRDSTQIPLPKEELVAPIRRFLERTHVKHVKEAAESAFGGPGLPTSPVTPAGMKNGGMVAIGLMPDQSHMTEIEADAFLAAYLPPAYASAAAVLVELRKRLGSDWIQSRLKEGPEGGLSVLDAGAGGAGLVAWEQIVNAEWELLKERGEVTEKKPPVGKKSVIARSDRLRNRLKTFLHDTTFLPRLPDYEHSGPMKGGHLDAGPEPQPRKQFDVIIACHLFLKEKLEHHRQAVLNNLWSLLNPDGGILIVMEKAHPRGFEAVAHVRETVIKSFLLPQPGEAGPETEASVEGEDKKKLDPAFNRDLQPGYIVAPCTNHKTCPMYEETGISKGRKDFCRFNQRFVQPQFYTQMLGKKSNNQGDVEFSYVVFRRGQSRPDSAISGEKATEQAFQGYEDSKQAPDMHALPRLILSPLKRKGHITLDVCTPAGKIERWTVPKSYSKLAYHDARKSSWGDLWALGAKTRVPRNVRVGKHLDDNTSKGKGMGDGGKKARRVKLSEDEQRALAMEKKALRDRGPKSNAAKEQDLLRELVFAEKRNDELLSQELDREMAESVSEAEAALGGRTGRDGR